MFTPILLAKIALGGVSLGALVAVTVGVWRSAAGRPAAIALVWMNLGIAGHLIEEMLFRADIGGPWSLPVHLLSVAAGGLIWLFMGVVFEDARISRTTLAPAAILTVLGMSGHLLEFGPARAAIWLIYNLSIVGLALHALWRVWRMAPNDLVEPRRRLRAPFLAAVALYMVFLATGQAVEIFGINLDWLDLVNVLTVACLCIAGAAIFLRAEAELFAPASPSLQAPPALPDTRPSPNAQGTLPSGPDAADRAEIQRLLDHMNQSRPWADEGLSLEALSNSLAIPEHRLRRLINVHLGFRNFAHFVNGYRIAEAKRILGDPQEARRTVSSIAFDLGFGSLGPFNRAFRESTGQTPTEFRRDALNPTSPNSEKSG
jgi:AraC-like DNA-binding protein